MALFNINVKRTFRDIKDGTSETIALSETITGPDGSSDIRGVWWNDWGVQFTGHRGPNSSIADAVWVLVGPGSPYGSYCDPGKAPCDGSAPNWSNIDFAARSFHPGGINVLFADGSVRFIADEINLATWQALGSIRSAEVVQEDAGS